MKNSKLRKVLLLACSAVLLVCLSVGATLAYLTDTKTVTNTFTVGKVAITLDEAKVDLYGKVDTSATERVTTNEYKMIANHTYTKDPTIHVATGSEDCWLFVKLTNPLGDLETTDSAKTIAGQMTSDTYGWTRIDADNNIYAYKAIVSAGANVPVFGTFTLSDKITVDTTDPGDIVIVAYAIQADGFDTAEAAWTAAGSSFTN